MRAEPETVAPPQTGHSSPEPLRPIAEVVLLRQLDRVFHYSIPETFRSRLEPGMRVLVPFRSGWQTGIVTRRLRSSDIPRLKPIRELIDLQPQLDRPMMALARWISEYYQVGWGLAMKAILPPGMDVKIGRRYRLTEKGQREISETRGQKRADRPILKILGHSPRGLRFETLIQKLGRLAEDEGLPQTRKNRPVSRSARQQLSAWVRKGWIEETCIVPLPAKTRAHRRSKQEPLDHTDHPKELQDGTLRKAGPVGGIPEDLRRILGSGPFSAICLIAEKPESQPVITALAEETVRAGRSVILLVPEINSVSEWVARLKKHGLDSLGVLHSGLSVRERQTEWDRIRQGVSIVIGTRLAVFAPLPNPGLIVVEEEWDPAYKQDESPRYHARDVAVLRATHHGAIALLTSSAPSVETYANIRNGKYGSVRLKDPLPGPVPRVIDLSCSGRGTLVSDELLEAVKSRIEKKEPVVLLLNRRGYGTALYCRDCGQTIRCHRCHVAMVYSKKKHQLSCRYCGTIREAPTVCPECRGGYLDLIGFGTEQAEHFFQKKFPEARIARLDRDTARQADVGKLMDQLRSSNLDIIIGTQLLLKGSGEAFGMPRPGLVGLLLADGAFHLPDFRAGEKTFQLISRVQSFSRGSELILQTYYPNHESIAWVASGNAEKFYEQDLAQRKALGYPPFSRLAVITAKAFKESVAQAAAQRLADQLKRNIRQAGVQVLGPSAASRPRLREKYRWQILVKAPDHRCLHQVLQSGLKSLRSESDRAKVWYEVDVDPQKIV